MRIADLENEIQQFRQRLQTTIEEFESSQEEMKASNEEMQSTNEELRSTLEERETSKEELQSINEELQTVNQENCHKVEALSQISIYLHFTPGFYTARVPRTRQADRYYASHQKWILAPSWI